MVNNITLIDKISNSITLLVSESDDLNNIVIDNMILNSVTKFINNNKQHNDLVDLIKLVLNKIKFG